MLPQMEFRAKELKKIQNFYVDYLNTLQPFFKEGQHL